MKSKTWKLFLTVLGILVYCVVLVYIYSIQSNYKVVIECEQEVYEFTSDMEGYSIPVEIRNKANRMLSSEQRIFLSYHVYDGNGNVLAYDNVRSELGKNIFSHSTERVELKVDALEPGEYILGIDVVEEGVTWFSEHEEMEKKLRIAVK